MTDGQPMATLVVSFRERWSLTLRSLESIAAHTPPPTPIWVLDTGMPADLRRELEARRDAWRLRLIDLPSDLWPTQARGRVAPEIETPYAVFIDNDVLVMPGWLNALVTCAEETGAGIVGPLYLWGLDGDSDLIHMAGGDLYVSEENGRRVMGDSHRHCMKRAADMAGRIVRETCGFAEYHCMMMRREVFRDPRVFDPEIVCVHEHIHASLLARELGYETWLEPASRVLYLAFSPWRPDELTKFRWRWDREAGERSLARFAACWNVIDDARSFGGVRGFLARHTSMVDPLLNGRGPIPDADRLMTRSDLEQTLAGLIWQARRKGYDASEIQHLIQGGVMVMQLFDGMYRPCGRPFLNHLVGTASVLVFYGFEISLVLAGLLHATFSHGLYSRSAHNDAQLRDRFSVLGRQAGRVSGLAMAYDQRHAAYRDMLARHGDPATLPMPLVNLLLLETANDIDMHLSLEVAASQRSDVPIGTLHEAMLKVCATVGRPAMAATLRACHEAPMSMPRISFKGMRGSFYLTEDGPVSALRGIQRQAVPSSAPQVQMTA